MITFDGYISGKAEKRFIEKQRNLILIVFIPALAISYFIAYGLFMGVMTHITDTEFTIGYIIFCILVILLGLIVTKSKKENLKVMPYKIEIKDGYITAITKRQVETKAIEMVKEVVDYGEFYDLQFYYIAGRSFAFICQKDLLTQGTLEEFERIFKDKLIKK